MDLLNETVLLKAKSTLFNLFMRETSHFLCYERLLNMTYVAYKKCIFPRNAILVALLYSGFISSTIKTISIQNSIRIPFGCKKCLFLHDTRLWFPDYSESMCVCTNSLKPWCTRPTEAKFNVAPPCDRVKMESLFK